MAEQPPQVSPPPQPQQVEQPQRVADMSVDMSVFEGVFGEAEFRLEQPPVGGTVPPELRGDFDALDAYISTGRPEEPIVTLGMSAPYAEPMFEERVGTQLPPLSNYLKIGAYLPSFLADPANAQLAAPIEAIMTDWKRYATDLAKKTEDYAVLRSDNPRAVERARQEEKLNLMHAWRTKYMKILGRVMYPSPRPNVNVTGVYQFYLEDEDKDIAAAAMDTLQAHMQATDASGKVLPKGREKYMSKLASFKVLLDKKLGESSLYFATANSARGLQQVYYGAGRTASDVLISYQPIDRELVAAEAKKYKQFLEDFLLVTPETSFDMFLRMTASRQTPRSWSPFHGVIRDPDHMEKSLFCLQEFKIAESVAEDPRLTDEALLYAVCASNYFVPLLGRCLVYVTPPRMLETPGMTEKVRDVWTTLDLSPLAHDSVLFLNSGNSDSDPGYALVLRMREPQDVVCYMFCWNAEKQYDRKHWFPGVAQRIRDLIETSSPRVGGDSALASMLTSFAASRISDAEMQANVDAGLDSIKRTDCSIRETALLSAVLCAMEPDPDHVALFADVVKTFAAEVAHAALLEFVVNGWPKPKMTLIGRLLSRMPQPDTVSQMPVNPGSILTYISQLEEDAQPLYRYDPAAILYELGQLSESKRATGIKSDAGREPIDEQESRVLAADVSWSQHPIARDAEMVEGKPSIRMRYGWAVSGQQAPEARLLSFSNETLFSAPLVTDPAVKEKFHQFEQLYLTAGKDGYQGAEGVNRAIAKLATLIPVNPEELHDLTESAQDAYDQLEKMEGVGWKKLEIIPPSFFTTIFADPMEHMFSSIAGLFCGFPGMKFTKLPRKDSVRCRVHDLRNSLSLFSCESLFPLAAYMPPCAGKLLGEEPRFLNPHLTALLPRSAYTWAAYIAKQYEYYLQLAMVAIFAPGHQKRTVKEVHGGDKSLVIPSKQHRKYRSITDSLHVPMVGPQLEPMLTFRDPMVLATAMNEPDVLAQFERGRKRGGPHAAAKKGERKVKTMQTIGFGISQGLAKQMLESNLVTCTTPTQLEAMIVCMNALDTHFTALSEGKDLPQKATVTINCRHSADGKSVRTFEYRPKDVICEMYPDSGVSFMLTGAHLDKALEDMATEARLPTAQKDIPGKQGMNTARSLNQEGLDVGWTMYHIWTILQKHIEMFAGSSNASDVKNVGERTYLELRGIFLQAGDLTPNYAEMGMDLVIQLLRRVATSLDILKSSTGNRTVFDLCSTGDLREPLVSQALPEVAAEGEETTSEGIRSGARRYAPVSATWSDMLTYLSKKKIVQTGKWTIPTTPCDSREEFSAVAEFIRACVIAMCEYVPNVPRASLVSLALRGYPIQSDEVQAAVNDYNKHATIAKRLGQSQTVVSSLQNMVSLMPSLCRLVSGPAEVLDLVPTHYVASHTGVEMKTEEVAPGPVSLFGGAKATGEGQTESPQQTLPTSTFLVATAPPGQYSSEPPLLPTQMVSQDEWTKKLALARTKIVVRTVMAFSRVLQQLPEDLKARCLEALKNYRRVKANLTLAALEEIWEQLRLRRTKNPVYLKITEDMLSTHLWKAFDDCSTFFQHDQTFRDLPPGGPHVLRRDETLAQLREETSRLLQDEASLCFAKRCEPRDFLACCALRAIDAIRADMERKLTTLILTPTSRVTVTVCLTARQIKRLGEGQKTGSPLVYMIDDTGNTFEGIPLAKVKDLGGQDAVLVDSWRNRISARGTCCARRLRIPVTYREAWDYARYQHSQLGLTDAVILWMDEVFRGCRCCCSQMTVCRDEKRPAACLMKGFSEDGMDSTFVDWEDVTCRAETLFGRDFLRAAHGVIRKLHRGSVTVECAKSILEELRHRSWPSDAVSPLFLPACGCMHVGCPAGPVSREMIESPARCVTLESLRAEDVFSYSGNKRVRANVDGEIVDLAVMDQSTGEVLPSCDSAVIEQEKGDQKRVPPLGLVAVFNDHAESDSKDRVDEKYLCDSDKLQMALSYLACVMDKSADFRRALESLHTVHAEVPRSMSDEEREEDAKSLNKIVINEFGAFVWAVKQRAEWLKARNTRAMMTTKDVKKGVVAFGVRNAARLMMLAMEEEKEEVAEKKGKKLLEEISINATKAQVLACALSDLSFDEMETVFSRAKSLKSLTSGLPADRAKFLAELRQLAGREASPLVPYLDQEKGEKAKVDRLSDNEEMMARTPEGILILASSLIGDPPAETLAKLRRKGGNIDRGTLAWALRKILQTDDRKRTENVERQLAFALLARETYNRSLPSTEDALLAASRATIDWHAKEVIDMISMSNNPFATQKKSRIFNVSKLPNYLGRTVMLLGTGENEKWLKEAADIGFRSLDPSDTKSSEWQAKRKKIMEGPPPEGEEEEEEEEQEGEEAEKEKGPPPTPEADISTPAQTISEPATPEQKQGIGKGREEESPK